ncbi:MAG: hypothetical protein R6X02_09875 [Enhygromyxa sp.]
MNLVRDAKAITDPNTGHGELTVDNPTLTLRANINVFRKGAHDDSLTASQWNSPNRLGGSVLLVAEDRESVVEKFVFIRHVKKLDEEGVEKEVKEHVDMAVRVWPIDPLPEGPGYYRAYLPQPSGSGASPPTSFPSAYRGSELVIELIERVGFIWSVTNPDRPFGLGEVFAASHESHFTGMAWDILTLRKDSVREYRDPSKKPAVWIPGETVDVGTTGRDAAFPQNFAHFDPVGMEAMIMLFVDVLLLGAGKSIRFYQIAFDDKKVTASVKHRRGVNIGTETQVMKKPQGTHGWHIHFLLQAKH